MIRRIKNDESNFSRGSIYYAGIDCNKFQFQRLKGVTYEKM